MDCCWRRKATAKRGQKDRSLTSHNRLKTLAPTDDYRASSSVAVPPHSRIAPVIRPNDDGDVIQCRPAAVASPRRDNHRFLYRVKDIPSDYTKSRLKADLLREFEIGDDSLLRIRSLCFDIPRREQSSICTAIISFGEPVEQLRKTNLVRKVGGTKLSFDTIFNGFTPLSPMETSSQQKLECVDPHSLRSPPALGYADEMRSCIIIPGWGGHPLGSFMSESSPHVWLIDDLARDFPQLRIWTYGYSPQIQHQTSGEDVYEFADSFVRLLRGLRQNFQKPRENTPIIYLAHSLGGLLFKDAIIRQRFSQDATDRLALDSTFGAMFFAVPSSGMDVEALALMVHNMPARTTLDDLDKRVGHRRKRKLHSDFCAAFDFEDAIIARFYELNDSPTVVRVSAKAPRAQIGLLDINFPTKDPTAPSGWSQTGPRKLLVDFESATKARPRDIDDEWICGLQGNHSTLVKLPEYFNQNYNKITDMLRKFSDRAPAVIDNRLAPAASEHQKKGRPDLSLDLREIATDCNNSKQASQREREECLESLSFPQMNTRERRVDDGAESTCQWLLRKSQWIRWFDENRSGAGKEFLWIKGNPGSGKSTLMKYMSQILKARADSILVSFFFDARGSSLEKSSHGLFSSMLHGLLSQVPHLLNDLVSLRRQKPKREESPWRENELKEFFCRAVTSLGEQQLYIQIDALDECHEVELSDHQNARELIRFFEDILLTTVQVSKNVHLVVSSRHYPHITATRGITALEIIMERENAADIRQYVTSWLNAPQSWELGSSEILSPRTSPTGEEVEEVTVGHRYRRYKDVSAHTSWSSSEEYAMERESLVDEVVERSSGIFLWVKLVVTKLKTAQDRGKPTKYLRKILAEIPPDLNRLFTGMMQDVDNEDREDTEKLIRWVLFAFSPLDRASLQIAMEYDTETAADSMKTWEKSPNYMPEVRFSNRVRDLSRGLIEFRRSDDKFRAYFIHDTVRTFFLNFWNAGTVERKSRRDNFLLMVGCLNFLRTKEMREQKPVSLTEAAYSRHAPGTPHFEKTGLKFSYFSSGDAVNILDNKLPFWRYATSTLFLHARLADPALSSSFLSKTLGATWPLDRTSIYWVWEQFYRLYSSLERNYAQTEYRIWTTISSISSKWQSYNDVAINNKLPEWMVDNRVRSYTDHLIRFVAMDVVFYAALLGLADYLDILLEQKPPHYVKAVEEFASLIGSHGRFRKEILGGETLESRTSFPHDDAIGYPELVAMAKGMPNYEEKVHSLATALVCSGEDAVLLSSDEDVAAAVGVVHELMGLLSTYRPPW